MVIVIARGQASTLLVVIVLDVSAEVVLRTQAERVWIRVWMEIFLGVVGDGRSLVRGEGRGE